MGIIRKGKWKLLEHYETGSYELFDLENDLGETRNLAEGQQEIVKELAAALSNWRTAIGADLMRPNPDYRKP